MVCLTKWRASIDCEEATLALLELLEEEDDRVTKRGKTRHLIKRRGEKGYFNNTAAAERLIVTLRIPRDRRNLSIPKSFQFRISRAAISQFSGFQRLRCPFFFEEIACTLFGE